MTKILSRLCAIGAMLFISGSVQAQTISNQPQSIIVNNASDATFSVGASGATNFQWMFNGTNLSDSTNGLVVISGSTNATLTLEDVSSNQMGNYSVEINGSVTSSNATLTVTNGTVITFTFANLLTNAPGSNVTVQLFDHDKPATVQNFLHYVTSGAYSNMFMDRVAPGAVLQGGDNGASNQTSMTPPLGGWDIQSFIASNNFNPPFPADLDNEFGTGPLIHNSYGTIAMAMGSDTNSANSAFYFNLTNNSTGGYGLDAGNFTVFGRVMATDTNVLNYFNTLSNGYGAINPATFYDYGVSNTVPGLNMLPVNYTGTNAPANSNLVFVSFSFPNGAPPANVDTNLPTVSITTPAAPAIVTNLMLEGTASDSVALADVICSLTGVATDGVYPSGYTNTPKTNYAAGGTNWSLSLYPGTYNVSVRSQNADGYLSDPATNTVTLTGFEQTGVGTVWVYSGTNVTASNLVTTNAVGYPLQQESIYTWVARPGADQQFANWQIVGYTVTSTNLTFYYDGQLLTANFVSYSPPRGSKGNSFTYPTANQMVPTNTFMLKGKLASGFGPAEVTCQIYATNGGVGLPGTYQAVGAPITVSATTASWSMPITNLAPGQYRVTATATNSKYSSVIAENFTVTAFKAVAGTYVGLFQSSTGSSTPTTSGYVICTVSPTGAFSLRTTFPAYQTFTFGGQFSVSGSAAHSSKSIFLYQMNLALSGENEITGYLYSDNYALYSPFTCYKIATKLSDETTPATGKYILGLSIENSSITNGYAALSVTPSGGLNVAGALPDGSTFSESTHVGTNGSWPLYAVPSGYGGRGMVLGWMSNSPSGAVSGSVYWYKGTNFGSYYKNGVATNLTVSGTNYIPPSAGAYAVILNQLTNSVPVTNDVTVSGTRLTPTDATDKLSITLSPSGILSGHFVGTNSNSALQFRGAYFGPKEGGAGFILDGNDETGYFLFEPQ